ncbi:hypothetical protein TELCIR_20638, partial [Teladorsagia circumcincta]
ALATPITQPFQGVPTKIEKRLKFLGATPIVETGHADDQVGLNPEVLQRLTSKIEIALKREVPEKVDDGDVNSKQPKLILSPDPYEYPQFSLIRGKDKLSSDPALRVPVAPQQFLASSVSHEKLKRNHGIPWQNGAKMVGVASAPYDVTVVGTARVTDSDVSKPKHELVLDLGEWVCFPLLIRNVPYP